MHFCFEWPSYIFPAYLALFSLVSCTRSGEPTLHWRHFQNQSIENVKNGHAVSSDGNTIMSFDNSNFKIKIIERAMNRDKALSLTSGIEFSISTMYAERWLPYSGNITKVSTCKSELMPVPLSEEGSLETFKKGFSLFANSRSDFGVCDPAESIYRSLYFVIYCGQFETSYEVKLFSLQPKMTQLQLLSVFHGFSCKP
jgi:hypothetical protein